MVYKMIRKNYYLTKDQDLFLQSLKGLSISEHIRRAIDEYIERLNTLKVSRSPLKK